ncbi:MAG: phage regulatory protein [Pseudomonadales bacterium]|nr:phage regulatory protein [Pseudomonadales bacterium]|tara:strand:+ start:4858 stop:5148 length:291 start_codon:yes stop_codon:yes gene_type:complete
MSSREIADLTGKRHADVLRDIRKMLGDLEINERSFASVYSDSKGEERACFNLPKDLTITLVAGYNVKMRHRITVSWLELEEQNAPHQHLKDRCARL